MEQLVEYGEVRRGQIGVSVRDIAPDMAAKENRTEGAVIAEVVGGSPAEAAGLRKGDIVVAADGAPIRSAAQLRNRIGLAPLGSRVGLRVERDGAPRSVAVDIAAARSAGKRAGE